MAFVQLGVGNPLVHKLGRQLRDFVRWWLMETAGRARRGMGQANNSAFFELGFRSAIAEALLTYLRDILLPNIHDLAAFACIPLLLQRSFVKIADQRGPMLLLNNVDYFLVQPIF